MKLLIDECPSPSLAIVAAVLAAAPRAPHAESAMSAAARDWERRSGEAVRIEGIDDRGASFRRAVRRAPDCRRGWRTAGEISPPCPRSQPRRK